MKHPKFRFRSTVELLNEWGAEMPRLMGYDEAGGKDDFPRWQRKARRKLRDLMGFWPKSVTEPASWLLQTDREEDVIREHWVVESPFGDHMFLYRLFPADVEPKAVMLAFHGHGYYGADPVAGIVKGRYNEAQMASDCNYDYGLQFARRGYLVYALCQRGFSQRCDVDNPATGAECPPDVAVPPPGSSCLDINTRATLLGTSDMALRVQDAMHLLDWVRSRPGEKRLRVGCVGLSGGGHITELLSAVDTRVEAASIQGYFCYWADQIMGTTHCNCNYIPGLLRNFEQDDVCGLICPRPLLVTTADQDGVAPVKSFRKAYHSLKGIYRDQGVPGNLAQDIFEGGHEFTGRKAFAFFDRHLAG